MTHSEFVEAYKSGTVSVSVNRSRAWKVASSSILPKRYQYAAIFWSGVWILSIPAAIVLMIFVKWWVGILVLFFVTPALFRANRSSVCEFMIDHALEDEDFYAVAIEKGLIIVSDIFEAVKSGDVNQVKDVLRADPNAANYTRGVRERTPLWDAAINGHAALAEVLLDTGADTNRGLNAALPKYIRATPLHMAAMHGHLGFMRVLLRRGAEVEARTGDHIALGLGVGGSEKRPHSRLQECKLSHAETPLHAAVLFAQTEAAAVLLEHGADVNARDGLGNTALILALREGQGWEDTVKLLLAKGADANAAGDGGVTPLWLATVHKDREIVRLLLSKGADPSVRSQGGDSPLHATARNGDWDAALLLLDAGADHNARNERGYTALHLAEGNGDEETHFEGYKRETHINSVAAVLIGKGADVNASANLGETPLHQAAKYGHLLMVDSLLWCRAENSARDAAGATPADVARASGFEELATLIETYVRPARWMPRYMQAIWADEVEPRKEGESDYAYMTRLTQLGYTYTGMRQGHAVLADWDGKLRATVQGRSSATDVERQTPEPERLEVAAPKEVQIEAPGVANRVAVAQQVGPQKAQDHPVREARLDPLPAYMSHLIYAEQVEPRKEGEDYYHYCARLRQLGYVLAGQHHGQVVLDNFQGRLKPLAPEKAN